MLKITSNDVEKALRQALGSFGLDHVEIKEGYDQDGDPAVFVTAILVPNAGLIPGVVSISANSALTSVLSEHGESRLSYLYIRHPDDERPETDVDRAEPE